MSSRLRMDVFRNIMQQDAAYFDDPKHNVGNLTSRLATDSQNVQAAIDHRLAEVLNGIVSLFAGIAVAFWFGWSMAPIGLATALLLVIAQSVVAQYLKVRGHKDMESAIEASRVTSEIELGQNYRNIFRSSLSLSLTGKQFKPLRSRTICLKRSLLHPRNHVAVL